MRDDPDPTPYNGNGCEACGQSYQGAQTECENPTCVEERQLGNVLIDRLFREAAIGFQIPEDILRGTRP